MRSGFAALGPTYPIIPHTWRPPRRWTATPSKTTEARHRRASCVEGRLTELPAYESRNRTTEAPGLKLILGLRQHPHQRFSSARPDEDSCLSVESRVESGDLIEKGLRQLLVTDGDVLLDLCEPGHHRGRLRERTTLQGPAEEQRRRQPVTGDMSVEVDDVTGLLATEYGGLAAQGLQDVPVPNVRGYHANPMLLHQPVDAEVRHDRDDDDVDFQVERKDGEDLVAVDRSPFGIDGQHAVAVAVEGHAEVVRAGVALQEREIGGAAADVDVETVGLGGERQNLGPKLLEGARRDLRVRAVAA